MTIKGMTVNWKVLLALGLVVWVIVSSQTAFITAVVVLGALFYVSYTTGHRWIRRFRHEDPSIQAIQPVAVTGGTDSQGRALRSHDYRADR